jgi:hypothetical protein
MNTFLIIFLVFVIIIAIYFAVQVFNPSYLIRESVSLNILSSKDTKSSVQSSIDAKIIDNPGSVRYFYETWLYIHTNEPLKTENVLFNRGNNFVVTLKGSTLNVYVNNNSTDATVLSSGVLELGKSSPITLLASIPNFPFQKWAQLVIHVDGLSVDLYLDGKFVQNVKSDKPIATNTKDPITYGNQYTIGSITRFRRPATNINPQGVWNSYMLGSGQTRSITDYHLNAQITKNKGIRVDQRLF